MCEAEPLISAYRPATIPSQPALLVSSAVLLLVSRLIGSAVHRAALARLRFVALSRLTVTIFRLLSSIFVFLLPAMSARKRARTSLTQLSSVTQAPSHGDATQPTSSTPLTAGWHALLPEFVQHAASYLLLCPDIESINFNVRLLTGLSQVCVEWHAAV